MIIFSIFTLFWACNIFFCSADGSKFPSKDSDPALKTQSLWQNEEHFVHKRNTLEGSTEAPINPKTLATQEGFRDNVHNIKTKIKDKVNGTISSSKDKVKQKIKDKVKKKVEKKLDPTGGYLKLPAIIGIIVGLIVLLIICCVVSCCCCPFCILYKRRQVTYVTSDPSDVRLQPLDNTTQQNSNTPLTAQD